MAEVDLEELRKVALDHARMWLTRSGGHEVEDVAQCALLDFVKYAEANEVKDPKGLICVMARRRARKYREDWKAARGNRHLDMIGGVGDAAGGKALELPAEGGDPVLALLSRHDVELVRYAISQLRPVDREIARLTYEENPPLKGPEVAERMGLTAGVVRNRLVRIRRLLAELLEGVSE